MLKACLNGARPGGEGSPVPLTPEALARDAVAVAEAGAFAVHIHPRGADGRESLDGSDIGAAVAAVRQAAPGLPVGVSTGAWIERETARRHALIAAWDVLPDFASVNFIEEGAADLAATLGARGVGIEAGLWRREDAEALAASPVAHRCLRILIEPREQDPEAALAVADAICAVLDTARIEAPRLLHGSRATAWPVLRAAFERGLQSRIGLEDTDRLPDGSPPEGNAALVRAALLAG